MECLIRHVELYELEQIEELENELFSDSWNSGTLGREVQAGAHLWVYGDPIEGYLLERKTEDLLDILRVGVTKPAQGKGIGTTLIQHALEGSTHSMLTVRKKNLGAIKLYTNLGFQIHATILSSWIMLRTSS